MSDAAKPAWRRPGPAFLAVIAAAVVGILVGFSSWNSPPTAPTTTTTTPTSLTTTTPTSTQPS